MKFFATAFLLASSAISASAFSAVAPPSAVDPSKAANVAEPVDKTLKGIDADGSFDPVEGDHAAVTRNNNDEVWVQQVRILKFYSLLQAYGRDCRTNSNTVMEN